MGNKFNPNMNSGSKQATLTGKIAAVLNTPKRSNTRLETNHCVASSHSPKMPPNKPRKLAIS